MNPKIELPKSEFPVHVERLNSEGQGVATLNNFTLFVDGALPGEDIIAQIEIQKKNYATAVTKQVLAPSVERTEPACEYYEKCGGCQIMHMNYPAQLIYKRERVREALIRIGKMPKDTEIEPCLASPSPIRYRNKSQFNVAPGPTLGFYEKRSHKIVPIRDCLIHGSLGQELYSQVLELLKKYPLDPYVENSRTGFLRHVLIRTTTNPGQALLVFVTKAGNNALLEEISRILMETNPFLAGVVQNINEKPGNSIFGPTSHLLLGKSFIEENLCGLKFKISATSFFQVNTLQAEILFTTAIRMAELQGNENILDAYCGTGTFSLILARSARTVIGIESHPESIRDAKANALENNLSNITFLLGKVEELPTPVENIDVAFLDPPRKGCDPLFLQALMAKNPKKIIYVSCDPATLARDLAYLTKSGYKLSKVQPLDMFPQTTHVEIIALLVKNI